MASAFSMSPNEDGATTNDQKGIEVMSLLEERARLIREHITRLAFDELAERVREQHARLTSPPIPADFTYDRNGLRLGIAALEDELTELLDEWRANKKRLDAPGVAERLRHETLDVAAVAMLIVRNIPSTPPDTREVLPHETRAGQP